VRDIPEPARKRRPVQADYATVEVNSLILTHLKNYLLTEVIPFLDELPNYADNQEFRDWVLSTWVGTCIQRGLEEEGYFPKHNTRTKRGCLA